MPATYREIGESSSSEEEEDLENNTELDHSFYLRNLENRKIRIFQDARDHVQSLKINEKKNLDDYYDKAGEALQNTSIFKEPPGLRGLDEYQIIVSKCLEIELSWKETASRLFHKEQHPEVEKAVRQQYYTVLAEKIQYQILERITFLCCNHVTKLPILLYKYKNPSIDSGLWKELIDLSGDLEWRSSKTSLLNLFTHFVQVEDTEKDEFLQKLWKKTTSSWKHLLNKIVPHFFNNSVEQELLICIHEWFTSGEMSSYQLKKWKRLFEDIVIQVEEGLTISTVLLKGEHWGFGKHAEEHVTLFNKLLEDILELRRTQDFIQLVSPFLSPPQFELTDGGTRLKIFGKGMFLSDIVTEILKQKTVAVKEINIYANKFFGIDANLKNKDWHGMNLTIVADKITVWEESVIDVSGYSDESRRAVRQATTSLGKDGADGTDGEAGESSGNVAILTNQLRHPEKLTVRLNGGYGQGGQHGEKGSNGNNGVGITMAEFEKLILDYRSLYIDSWDIFAKYDPGPGWSVEKGETVYKRREEWIYKKYKHTDERELLYTFAADSGVIYNTYDILFYIKGTDGTMGGTGGKNGVSGQGGNSGVFIARNLKTGAELTNWKAIEREPGKAGKEGQPADYGDPGKNGNDMGMTDRSTGILSLWRRAAPSFYGEKGNDRLQLKYSYNKAKDNALNGWRKFRQKEKDFYTTLTSDPIKSAVIEKKTAEKRTVSDRIGKSLAVSKQTILVEELLEEYAKICVEDDHLNIGDIAEFKTFEVEEIEEEEEQEQIKEEVTVVHTLVEDSQEHERALRRLAVRPEEVIEEIKKAAKKLDKMDLVELIEIWKKIFTVPIDAVSIRPLMVVLFNKDYIDRFFKERKLVNGMTRRQVDEFAARTRVKYAEKKDLSLLKITMGDPTVGMEIEEENNELIDVEPVDLDPFWTEMNGDYSKTKLSQGVFNHIGENDLCESRDLLTSLYCINTFLVSKERVFKPFARDSIDWSNITAVQEHLQNFLTPEEKAAEEKKKEQEEKEEMARKLKEEQLKAEQDRQSTPNDNEVVAEKATFCNLTVTDANSGCKGKINKFSKRMGCKDIFNIRQPKEDPEPEVTNWFTPLSSLWNSKEESQAFKKVAQEFSDEKAIKRAFSNLISLLDKDKKMAERFSIERSFVTKSLKQPGSTTQSLVHMYFLTEQILNFNVQLVRYYIPYSSMVTIPVNWYNLEKEITMQTKQDLFTWANRNGMPGIDSDMSKFIDMNGIRCRTYRQMVADEKKVNVQVFCESGFGRMRLVENLNPECPEVHRLIFKGGELKTIAANEPLRKFRAVMKSCELNIALPRSTEPLQLASYFPDFFKEQVNEWTDAAIVATGFETLPRFFQRLFELRGNSMSIIDLQFAFNTLIEANKNFHIPLEELCSRMLRGEGELNDIFLALRVMGAMKGKIQNLEDLMNRLFTIKEPQLRTLFGSKLHEIQMTEKTLDSLIDMLSHAEDRVAQLETMPLQEWINIASEQKWNCYEPLLETYGKIGYYIVLLDPSENKPGQRLLQIIEKLTKKNEKVFILEKVISTIAFLISNNEVSFDNKYEQDVLRLLQIISQKCDSHLKEVHTLLLKHLKTKEAADLFTKTENIHLITNELLQRSLISIMEEEKDQWEAVVPPKERSLQELIRLTVNPQDSQKANKNRKEEMETIEKILSNKLEDNDGKLLNEIDDQLGRYYKKRLRHTQKIAILAAARSGKNLLSQVNTGEGKSFLIACLAILRIRKNPKDTVDIITSQSVLAQRDAEAMKELYDAFGIQVGHNCDEDIEKRKLAYKCGVVYGDISRFEMDFLIQTFYKKNILGSRVRCTVIVDEVDVMLLDNGSNMLYLSHNVAGLELLDSLFVYLHKLVNTPSLNEAEEENFNSGKLRQKVLADMCGLVTKEDIKGLLFDRREADTVRKIWRILITHKVIDSEGILQNNWDSCTLLVELQIGCNNLLAHRISAMLEIVKNRRQEIGIPAYLKPFVLTHLDEFIKNAKQNLFLKHKNEYVADLDRTGRSTDLHPVITIINKGTGTDLSTSQWSEGLHQFVQLKHGCRLSPFSLKAVFISNVSYLKGYERLNGFSGTLGSEEESNSLAELYNADMIKIPTRKPKMFNEKVPILSKNKEDWAKEIFDEICNQVMARRSVLVICQTIEKVEELEKTFKQLYNKMKKRAKKTSAKKLPIELDKAFQNFIVYSREFEEVDFSSNKKKKNNKTNNNKEKSSNNLGTCRVILSTNLSGRGTDITLAESLIKNGGLHVVVSFLPENSRIENQAYGRAARDGQKGSGQIICMVEEEGNGATNIFQLKQFRDNAEVHRLRSLKHYYDYHIAVEEKCLKLFEDHCSKMMEAVHTASDELTIDQIIYFALLDEWAGWLDSKAEEIRQCEKTKNDVLKDNIIASVKQFLTDHPLSKGRGYQKSLTWIRCPQPLLSISLLYMEVDRTDLAAELLNRIIKDFPGFEAEAYYYLGIIEQWNIHHPLAIVQPPEKEEEKETKQLEAYKRGKKWLKTGTRYLDGKRLKATNWMIRELVFNDNCPDDIVTKCVESVHRATEYLLLSRSLFASRIRKKEEMVRIVKTLQLESKTITSRGFAVQQEEAIAILECLIGSLDDLLGHRAKPEDVQLGGDAPQDVIHNFRQIMRGAGIITPPQLAVTVSDQQLQMLSTNHCLSLQLLKAGFQKIYENEELEEYDGQKIVKTSTLVDVFPLPSVQGFWESLQRANCLHSKQVLLGVRKEDKEKVPLLLEHTPTAVKLNPQQMQLSTENLDDYDFYDVAAEIKENDATNAKLQEAQEAGLVHVEVIATLDEDALDSCEYLDQFSYITVGDAAVELGIPANEAEWIMEVLRDHGMVERRELVKPPEENDSRKDISSTSQSTEGEGEGNPEVDPRVKEVITVYFPIDRISCEMFPSNMRASIRMMLSRNFCYHYALVDLKLKLIEEKAATSHPICLPAEPYVDLYNDLQNLGIIQHSRVTSVLSDIYKPRDNGKICKYGKKGGSYLKGGFVQLSSKVLPAETEKRNPLKYAKQGIDYVKEIDLSPVTNYIDPVIYKALEKKTPKLCTRKCELEATSAYLAAKNVPASGEIRKAVANGLKKVAMAHEKNWWKWLLGTFLRAIPMIVTAFVSTSYIAPQVLPYFALAVAAFAAVGTILYCMTLLTENQKIASTLNLGLEEEFTLLRTYHASALEAPKRERTNGKERKNVEKTVGDFVHLLIRKLELSTFLTPSDEDISDWLEALKHCAQKSTHLPLLQQAIELWFKNNTRNVQAKQFNNVFNAEEEKDLPQIIASPLMMFAFSSLLISEVNVRNKVKGQKKRAITTRLDFGASPVNPDELKLSSTCPLSLALSKSLKEILAPMIEETITAVVEPALSALDTAWRKSREPLTGRSEMYKKTLERKQQQHSAERLAKKQTVDFLATDLHNIFQKIAFRGATRPMLQHMIKFNYPLSPHCAKEIFDACVKILLSVDSELQQVDIELRRDDRLVFCYNGCKNGAEKKDHPPLIIGLERDSFYIVEAKEQVDKKYRLGLFQGLCEYSAKFSDQFATDSQTFVDQLHEKVAEDLVSKWSSAVVWCENEKLKCSVAFW